MTTNPNKGDTMNQAVEFARSHRGQYIVGQALYVAIQAMKKVPAPHTEHSNIADMEYLMKEMYPMYAAVHGPEVEEAFEKLKAMQEDK
jgi:hypothetical protein